MPNRGVLFALTEELAEEIALLPAFERVDFLLNNIEDKYYENNPDYTCELANSWDAIHRSLTDGFLGTENGEYPLNHVILGGSVLYGEQEEETDYLLILKDPEQVLDAAKALSVFTEQEFKQGYAKINNEDYEYHLGFADLEKALQVFRDLQIFWQRAATEDLYILFACDV